ncbi:MAG: hypothetical protein NZ870_02285, partial [bacterium]|nr:hypothetical protein [bacterium]
MESIFLIYQITGLIITPFVLIYYLIKKPINTKKELRYIHERLGIINKVNEAIAFVPSIGEATVFLTFYDKFKEKLRINFSVLTSTITARELLEKNNIEVHLTPIDNVLF